MIEAVVHVAAAPAQVSAAVDALSLPLVFATDRRTVRVEHTGDGSARLTLRMTPGRRLLLPYLNLHATRVKELAETTAQVDRAGLALVLHSIARDGGITGREWQPIARAVLAAGGDWPALADLAADGPMAISDSYLDADVHAAEKRLADQLTAEIGDRPPLEERDVTAGVSARAWTLGVISMYDFTELLGSNGYDASDDDTVGAAMMWEVWSTNALDGSTAVFGGHGGPGYDEQELRRRGDKLIPPDSINGPLAVLLTRVLRG
ncbi:hypothetical protein Acy02nite_90740 [Actinoplanes cyaneus]|uniref:Uncharacterized protein n=1 Tax=Actinoplanes cyaneus TaxID=52696 RepID=A0A919ITN0_9ACTN|nr:hypothetical protein [Actinoplanes cyaneus]GID71193.1 hypothetical protein Acy02nite_90740 [Actinoplanes cyaneus]